MAFKINSFVIQPNLRIAVEVTPAASYTWTPATFAGSPVLHIKATEGTTGVVRNYTLACASVSTNWVTTIGPFPAGSVQTLQAWFTDANGNTTQLSATSAPLTLPSSFKDLTAVLKAEVADILRAQAITIEGRTLNFYKDALNQPLFLPVSSTPVLNYPLCELGECVTKSEEQLSSVRFKHQIDLEINLYDNDLDEAQCQKRLAAFNTEIKNRLIAVANLNLCSLGLLEPIKFNDTGFAYTEDLENVAKAGCTLQVVFNQIRN